MATVWDQVEVWAEKHYPLLSGQPYSPDALAATLGTAMQQFPGISAKKWLFVYTEGSLFEVDAGFARIMLAHAKLHSMAANGGMIIGADFSKDWGRPTCKGVIAPLIVCKAN